MNAKGIFAVPTVAMLAILRRFRDTFAVELLLKGVPLERVSILLGTIRASRWRSGHCAPWIRERQEQAEAADVRRTRSNRSS
jgi:hypothetical protein